jgi:predicted metal-dependent phosphoesterase TrpH
VLKVDLHLHTAEDPTDNIVHDARALIDRAGELGFDALAITLHDRQLADRQVTAYARERGITLLPGIERTIQGRHVLLINFPQISEQVRTFEGMAALKARCNGIVIAPHPFFPVGMSLRGLLDAHVDLFDAVEWTYFWTRATNFNARAARWAQTHGKPLVGNSDLHDLRQLGRTYTRIQAEPDVDAICQAIRDGAVTLETSPVPVVELAKVVTGMIRRGRKSPARAGSEPARLATM